ncbi:hypothetical protein BaOVIS_012540 [Babesia ovis]|uniref:lipoate--protein ligase n=1 Tax=Babesia ovis TaxID=5869 RepID=A0A9W5WUC9_BABOV|nr:hypothetical protein BaOVIS_012540 [Babesia ovis]
MVRFLHCLRRGLTRATLVTVGRTATYPSGCEDTDTRTAGRYRGGVYLWGSACALPGGSGNHPLFQDAKGWRCVTFGPTFGAAIDINGRVYIWGQGGNGQFVQPFQLSCYGMVDCHCSSDDLYMLGGDSVVYVIKGLRQILEGYCDSARVNHPDTSRLCPSPIKDLNKRVVKISAGNSHAAFITDRGELYCTGDNSFGQCGTKPNKVKDNTIVTFEADRQSDTVDLHKVTFKDPNTKIVDVVCGGRHTCCVDTEGNIYTLVQACVDIIYRFGDDSSVQLFLGDTRGRTLLELDHYKPFVSHNDRGSRSYTKYTHTDRHLQFNPIPVSQMGKLNEYQAILRGSRISLAAGDDFTIVAATPGDERARSTHLIASGGNRFGQCASLDVRMHLPRSVKLPGSLLENFIACGSSHCMAVLDQGKLVGWGSNQQKQLDLGKHGNLPVPTEIDTGAPGDSNDHGQQVSRSIKFVRCAFNNTAVIFSGAAFKVLPNAALHHGTLLININQGSLDKYLTPDKSKLEKHNVQSVKARVTNLSQFNNKVSHEMICDAIIDEVAAYYKSPKSAVERVTASSKYCDQSAFKDCYLKLKDEKWIYGDQVTQYKSLKNRFDFGSVEFCFDVRGDQVAKIWIFSDCLNAEFITWLENRLSQTPMKLCADDFQRAMERLDYEGATDMLTAIKGWLIDALRQMESNAEQIVNEGG